MKNLPKFVVLALSLVWLQAWAQGISVLGGSWRVVLAEFEGKEDHQMVGSVWVFQGTTLHAQIPQKGNAQYRITPDSNTSPKALKLTPVGSPAEAGGWMIFSRQHDRLKLAFFDNLQGRPQGFQPQQNLAVLTLVPNTPGSSPSAAKLCQDLQAANPTPLLGGITEPLNSNATSPGPSCGLQGMGGRMVLAVVAAPGGKVYFEERLELSRRSTNSQMQSEPGLGGSAYSITQAQGHRVDFVILKRNVALILVFEVRADPVSVQQFVKRVVANYK